MSGDAGGRGPDERSRDDLERARLVLDAILEHFPDMVFVKEAENLSFVQVNRAGEALLGMSREQLLGKTDYDFFPADQAEFFRAKDRETLASGRPLAIPEEPIETALGVRWLHTTKVPIADAEGTPRYLLGISQDITTKKRAESELRAWGMLFERAQWGIAIGSADTKSLESLNPAFAEMHGYTVDELRGQPIRSLFPPDQWDALAEAIAAAHEKGHQKFESEHLRKDGTRFPVLIDMTAVRDENGRVLHRIVNVQDITALKESEAELRRAKDLAEASNAELEAFSYSVSHDLRAPLRAIDGFGQALLEDYAPQLDATGQDYLHRVRAAAQRMGRLIDDLLGLSRVSRVELDPKPVDLTRMARAIAAELSRQDPSRDVTFEIAPDLVVRGDAGLLRIALENLLGNAFKFTSKNPRATIELGRAGDSGPDVFFVRDDGAGFDMAHADKLFAAFHRLHSPKDFDGTGVGLATVARVIRRHGGRVWADAAPGRGATFFFEIPS